MIKVRHATVADIEWCASNALPVFDNGHDLEPGAKHCLERGVLMALEDSNNNLIGVLGGYVIWEGVASIGAILTPHLIPNRFGAVKAILRILRNAERDFNLHRIEMYVRADYTTGHKWAGTLGFQAEGTLRKYGSDKQDYTMYGRV